MKNDTLHRYFLEMGRFSVLSPEEEKKCATTMVGCFDALVDDLLEVPYVWHYIFNMWQELKIAGRASNKLAEEYGNPHHDATYLTIQIDSHIEAARVMSRAFHRTLNDTMKGRVKHHLKAAGLSKHIYLDLVDNVLAQPLDEALSAHIRSRRKAVIKSRHKLINANLRLVINFAKKFNGYGIPLSDLIQEGNIGLMRAAEKFDPSRNLKFSTYAAWWIRQSFIKALKKQGKTIRLPSHIHDAMSKIKKAYDQLYVQHKREPSMGEIADHLGMEPDFIEHLISLRSEPLSLDASWTGHNQKENSEGHRPLKDMIEDKVINPAEEMDTARRADMLLSAIKKGLSESEQMIIMLRFGLGGNEPHTLEQIADQLGKSRERVRQVETMALKRLKEFAPELEKFNE